ncbi:MAG: hypothetical protein JWP49_1176 [Phenylobacterium sp.]|nr:hypothetical protein [Phenylobacterium sp.]
MFETISRNPKGMQEDVAKVMKRLEPRQLFAPKRG